MGVNQLPLYVISFYNNAAHNKLLGLEKSPTLRITISVLGLKMERATKGGNRPVYIMHAKWASGVPVKWIGAGTYNNKSKVDG
jgi:hypothetical protein